MLTVVVLMGLAAGAMSQLSGGLDATAQLGLLASVADTNQVAVDSVVKFQAFATAFGTASASAETSLDISGAVDATAAAALSAGLTASTNVAAAGTLVFASAGSIEKEVKTSAAVTVEASLTVAADATLATKSWLLVKKDQSVDVAAKGKVAAAGLLLEGGNSVKVAAEGSLKAGAVAVGKGSSTIEGSVTVVGDKTLVVYEDAKLVLKGGADASAAATVDAKAQVYAATSTLAIEGHVKAEAEAEFSGDGVLMVTSGAALHAQEAASIVVGKLQVASDATLAVAAKTEAQVVAKAEEEATCEGKLEVTADASVNTFVIQHAKRTGKFSEVKINGQVAVEASGSASAGGKRSVRAEEWETEYGETETKFTKKSGDGSGPAPAPGNGPVPAPAPGNNPSGPSPSGESAASVQTISALVSAAVALVVFA
mmetsp:Transcript_15374/g.26480  ORF Transcript_15374/g.26480 Transcript_15374/m.26480 type:complete len:427 (-) Transcript_15374:85-1365(-)|eukprot:CAMPEP_0168590372 /NCGR_PEP_ID=MMETSP0420-20121227/6533_1 /TAXON_ID=498008 /ORGANISM="Pessonella sp." /LENGTH=426 /DNA_ID=CAMNT_0008626027 /DNA_START=87 /DNA_END=1367 /DNA_ORIENTATION=+